MGLYRRGKYFWFTIMQNGKRIQVSTKTASKKLAERIYAKNLMDIQEGRWFQNEAKRRTFEEFRDRYMKTYAVPIKSPSTVEKDKYSFKRLSEFFGGCKLSEITPQKIADYKWHRREAGIKPSTLARELELLRAALNIAIREWEWLEVNPFWKVKIEQPRGHRERWLTIEEESRLLDASSPRLKDIVIFALNTGMRRGEILSLKWSQVDMSRCTVTLTETKNGEKMTIPINQVAIEVLMAKSKVRHISGYVFPSETGTMIQAGNLLRAFYSARKKAGLNDVRFHDLRHTFATRLVQAGIELYVVKELLGHKSFKMTMRYAHHYPESLRHGVDILDRLKGAPAAICYNFTTVAEKRGHGIAVTP